MNVSQIHIQYLLIILVQNISFLLLKYDQNIYEQFNLCNMLITLTTNNTTTNNTIDSEVNFIYN